MESFKKSFTLYVEGGMMKMVEIDIDSMWRNELHFKKGRILVMEEFKARFYKFIVNHYLRKFHCLYLHSKRCDLSTVITYIQPSLGNLETGLVTRRNNFPNKPVEKLRPAPVPVERMKKSSLGCED